MRTPAKINLGLEILRKREDGYHEINSLFVPISLYDELTFTLTAGEITLTCATLPADESNLCVRAANAMRASFGVRDRGVAITLTKNIPVGAGPAAMGPDSE